MGPWKLEWRWEFPENVIVYRSEGLSTKQWFSDLSITPESPRELINCADAHRSQLGRSALGGSGWGGCFGRRCLACSLKNPGMWFPAGTWEDNYLDTCVTPFSATAPLEPAPPLPGPVRGTEPSHRSRADPLLALEAQQQRLTWDLVTQPVTVNSWGADPPQRLRAGIHSVSAQVFSWVRTVETSFEISLPPSCIAGGFKWTPANNRDWTGRVLPQVIRKALLGNCRAS